ncbi:MAG: hypothetical protein SH857_03895 [Chitinophagales bacterium]|nr:hypothetical protein [Chitinophagales bacterium]
MKKKKNAKDGLHPTVQQLKGIIKDAGRYSELKERTKKRHD